MSFHQRRAPEDVGSRAAQLLVRLGFGVLAIAIPCGAVLSRLLIFSLMPIGCVLILSGALVQTDGGWKQLRQMVLSPAGLALIFLLAWMGLSLGWTPFVGDAAARYGKTVGTILLTALAAGFMPMRTRTSNLYLMPMGVGAAALALLLVVFFGPQSLVAAKDMDGSTLQRAVIILVLLTWPAIGVLAIRERWITAAMLATVVAAAAVAVWVPVAILSFILGALVFAVAMSAAVVTSRVLGVLVAAGFLVSPAVAFLARVVLGSRPTVPAILLPALSWGEVIGADGIRLLTGHGTNAVTSGLVAGYLSYRTPTGELFEIWYELGIIGAVAVAVLAMRAFLAAGRAAPTLAPFLFGGIMGAFFIAMFAVSIAQLWFLTLICVGALAFTALMRGQYRTVRPPVRVLSDAPPESAV